MKNTVKFYRRFIIGALFALVIAGLSYAVYHQSVGQSQLDQILSRGKIRFVMRNTATNVYAGTQAVEGFELKLAELYAQHLGVELEIITKDSVQEVVETLDSGRADIAAGGLTKGVERTPAVRYSHVYQVIDEKVVYKQGKPRPSKLADLAKGRVAVTAGSSYAKSLDALKEKYPDIKYEIFEDGDVYTLMEQVAQGKLDYTIVDSSDLEQFRRFYPELSVGFVFANHQELAWAMKPITYHHELYNVLSKLKYLGLNTQTEWLQETFAMDDSLVNSVNEFLGGLTDSGELEWLLDVYYGHLQKFDYLDTRSFIQRIKSTLPRYKALFKRAAQQQGVDWKIIAAIGYQESHWRPSAVSPTGVRGIMMLTQNTARVVKVTNRLDPEQSIQGGAKYFRMMLEQIPDSVEEPDRTWMALASYNIGYGHLDDVRKLAARNGGDPDKWQDVRIWLPKKHQKQWYTQTRYGYARGNEAVIYVENIRRYYDILIWLDKKEGL